MCRSDLKKNPPFLYAISGYKNSGKTTLITKLIPVLLAKGYKVATIKHDGHDFEGDVPGTDTYQHQQAGAFGSAIFSGNRLMISRQADHVTEQELIQAFPEADIILLEGFKFSSYPKYMIEKESPPLSREEVETLAEDIIAEMKKFMGI